MSKYKNVIKKIILVLVLAIILILILLFIMKKNNEKNEDKEYSAEEGFGIDKSLNVKEVDSPTMFYTVQNIVIKYLEYVHLDYERKGEDNGTSNIESLAEKYEVFSEEEKKDSIIKLLDINYVQENNISAENLENFILIDKDQVTISNVLKMNVLQNEQFQFYSVYIEVKTESGKTYKEYYLVTLDEYNSTYMIKPIKNCNDINEIQLQKDIKLKQIDNNQLNIYAYERVNDAQMSINYFVEYRQLMISNTMEAYNKLDEEYRNKRFGNYENFEKYVYNNKEEISKWSVAKYLVNEFSQYKEYVCKDEFDNIYTFKVTGIKEYTVKLDTYTIQTDKFMETYENATDEQKVGMNIDKWFLMLNSRDYVAAYNVLDEEFRNNNFGSEEKFEEYMRKIFPSHYQVSQGEISKQSDDIYTKEITYTDMTEEEDQIAEIEGKIKYENTIIMKLGEGTDFVMSFYVRRH